MSNDNEILDSHSQQEKMSEEKSEHKAAHAKELMQELESNYNILFMRLQEWYGWHFPELARVVVDPILYCKVVLRVGIRDKNNYDLSDILSPELSDSVNTSIQHSMGTDITAEDIRYICDLATGVLDIENVRAKSLPHLSSIIQKGPE
jgi:nucleolar protein 58